MSSSDALALFGDHYALDGNVLRCTDCGQTQPVSWGNDDHGFPHMANCPCVDPKSPVPDKPWRFLVDAICQASGYSPSEKLAEPMAQNTDPRVWHPLTALEFDTKKSFHIIVRWTVTQSYRWWPYKRGSQQSQRGLLTGRWQKIGEYGGWDNARLPDGSEWTDDNQN